MTVLGLLFLFIAILATFFMIANLFSVIFAAHAAIIKERDVDNIEVAPTRFLMILCAFMWTLVFYWYN